MYNQPANKFVFSFIGLSNFIEVEQREGQLFVSGANITLPELLLPPGNLHGQQQLSLASRPSEIDFVSETEQFALPGIVKRKAFLGEIIDYQVKIGNQELRIQKGRREQGPEIGESCYLRFARHFWYGND